MRGHLQRCHVREHLSGTEENVIADGGRTREHRCKSNGGKHICIVRLTTEIRSVIHLGSNSKSVYVNAITQQPGAAAPASLTSS